MIQPPKGEIKLRDAVLIKPNNSLTIEDAAEALERLLRNLQLRKGPSRHVRTGSGSVACAHQTQSEPDSIPLDLKEMFR